MTVTALDTHEVGKELRAVGFTDQQAEAVTLVLRKSQEIDLSNLMTKADLQLGTASAKADLQIGLADTKAEILKWMVGTVSVQTVIILGAVAALARSVPH